MISLTPVISLTPITFSVHFPKTSNGRPNPLLHEIKRTVEWWVSWILEAHCRMVGVLDFGG